MYRKVAAVWVSLLIMVSSIVVLVEIADRVEAPTTLYVGGGGPGNYSKIQWAIDNATTGDTVFVYSGTHYENIIVNKTINLNGENSDYTIINGSGNRDVIRVNADFVNITGFTITNGSSGIYLSSTSNGQILNNNISYNINSSNPGGTPGIAIIRSNYNVINNNYISNNGGVTIFERGYGIYNWYSSNNHISNNDILYNEESAIYLRGSSNNTISSNTLGFSVNGIDFWESSNNNTIEFNNISSSWVYGLEIRQSLRNNIINNQISNCGRGIQLGLSANENNILSNIIYLNTGKGIEILGSYSNKIYHNNIINNNIQASDDTDSGNEWDNGYPGGGNYWSDFDEPSEGAYDDYNGQDQDMIGPDGIIDNGSIAGGGKNPYVIDSNSQDNYPLIKPYKKYMILKHGWNLISIPIIPPVEYIPQVLSSIQGLYDAVQWYNNSDTNDHWKHYKENKTYGNDLFGLNEKLGFWIYIIPYGDTIFLYNGTQPTSNQTIQLHPGWNMVGYPSLTSHNRTTGLNNLTFDTHVDCIQWYDAGTKTWHFMGPNDNFVPGRGYWVHSKVDAEWEVPL